LTMSLLWNGFFTRHSRSVETVSALRQLETIKY
jgi:hypothetical protein